VTYRVLNFQRWDTLEKAIEVITEDYV